LRQAVRGHGVPLNLRWPHIGGRIEWYEVPSHRLPQCVEQNAMDVADCGGRQLALAPRPFGSDPAIGGCDCVRLELGQEYGAEGGVSILGDQLRVPLVSSRRDAGLRMFEPLRHEACNRQLVRRDARSIFHIGDEARAFGLRLPVGAGEAMLTPSTLSRFDIAHVENDCPMPRRAFADVTFHVALLILFISP